MITPSVNSDSVDVPSSSSPQVGHRLQKDDRHVFSDEPTGALGISLSKLSMGDNGNAAVGNTIGGSQNNGSAIGAGLYGNMAHSRSFNGDQSGLGVGLNWPSATSTGGGFVLQEQQEQSRSGINLEALAVSSTENSVRQARPSTPPTQRKRGESIDMFLSRSPSQSLGAEFLKFRRDSDGSGIPSVPLDGDNRGTVAVPGNGSFHGTNNKPPPPPGIGRDSSPSCSVTGTTASSRSVSPNAVDNNGRRSNFSAHYSDSTHIGQPMNHGYNHNPQLPIGGTNMPAYDHGAFQQKTDLGRIHTKNPAQRQHLQYNNLMHANNRNSLHMTNPGMNGAPVNDFQYRIGNNSKKNFFPGDRQGNQQQYQQGPVIGSDNAMNKSGNSLQISGGSLQQHSQQHMSQDLNPQQVFYMAVPTQDGRGQVLQPIQMVQLPGQPPALVLPTGSPATGLVNPNGNSQTVSMVQQGQVNSMMVMSSPQAVAGVSNDVHPNNGNKRRNQRNKNVSHIIPNHRGSHTSGHKHFGHNPNGKKHHKNTSDVGTMNIMDDQYISNSSAQDNTGAGQQAFGENHFESKHVSNADGRFGQDDVNTGFHHGDGHPVQDESPRSNDFIASLYASPQRPPLQDLLGHVRRLSRDQVGCRLLQQSLDEEGSTAATLILNEGLSFWGEAMVDPFGNYLFQKILEKITAEERVTLVENVSSRLVNASLNLHGTRSVQKVVELCANDEAATMIRMKGRSKVSSGTAAEILTRALAPAAARLCIDSHGNHVIQRILLKLPYHHSHFVFDAVAASVGDVARHRHGCCVIQRCLDSPPSAARSHLVHRIVEKSLELMQDAYGNYVVQYVLDVCSDEDVYAVCESVVGKVNLLAIQKFSSNVMEKCLERCTDRIREFYLSELSESDRIRELMMDPFGNYVIQRALAVATHAQAINLVEAMRPHLMSSTPGSGPNSGGMRNTAGGRRIMAKICRRFPNFNLGNGIVGEEQPVHRRHNNFYQEQITSNSSAMNVHNSSNAPIPRDRHHQNNRHRQQHNIVQGHGSNDTNYLALGSGSVSYPHM